MPIPEQFIDELVARSEISDVVSSYVHLTRKGNNLWGLCPFHNEKTWYSATGQSWSDL